MLVSRKIKLYLLPSSTYVKDVRFVSLEGITHSDIPTIVFRLGTISQVLMTFLSLDIAITKLQKC